TRLCLSNRGEFRVLNVATNAFRRVRQDLGLGNIAANTDRLHEPPDAIAVSVVELCTVARIGELADGDLLVQTGQHSMPSKDVTQPRSYPFHAALNNPGSSSGSRRRHLLPVQTVEL